MTRHPLSTQSTCRTDLTTCLVTRQYVPMTTTHTTTVNLAKSPVYRAWNRIAATEDCRPWLEYVEMAKRFPSGLPQNALRFDNISDMKRRVTASGSHFYDADTIRYFKAKTDNTMINGRFWVESARMDADTPRRYRVAWAWLEESEAGQRRITIERLGYYPTLKAARNARRMLAEAVRAEAQA